MKDQKEDKVMKDALNTMTEAEASYGLSVWFGAIFFFLINRREITC